MTDDNFPFAEINGYAFRRSEVLFVKPIDETQCQIVFRNGQSLLLSLVRKRVKRNGEEEVSYLTAEDVIKLL